MLGNNLKLQIINQFPPCFVVSITNQNKLFFKNQKYFEIVVRRTCLDGTKRSRRQQIFVKKRPHFLALFYVSSSHAKMLSKEAPKVFLAVENSKKGRISFNKCWGV